MSQFEWTEKKGACAVMLAEGYTQEEVARGNDISRQTITRWLRNIEFSQEVDRLSAMVALASCAGRLRLAQRTARKFIKDDGIETEKDLLDWLKFIQSETDGIKSTLSASLLDLIATMAGRDDRPGTSGETE